MSRNWYGVAFAATIAVGTLSRTFSIGYVIFDKYLGDALYAVAIYLVFALVNPKRSPILRASAALVTVVAIECFQLTGWAADWRDGASATMRLASVVLGTTFGWLDLLAYAAGLAGIYGAESYSLGSDRPANLSST